MSIDPNSKSTAASLSQSSSEDNARTKKWLEKMLSLPFEEQSDEREDPERYLQKLGEKLEQLPFPYCQYSDAKKALLEHVKSQIYKGKQS